MGIQSDVVVALKHNVYDSLSEDSKLFLRSRFGDPTENNEEGLLYHLEYIKWYHDTYADIISFYQDLFENHHHEDYLIVEACHDHPEYDGANCGEWQDNPWNIYKSISVHIEWA